MKTNHIPEESTNSHNNPDGSVIASYPPPVTVSTPPTNRFTALISPALREGFFRARSFAANLDEKQRAMLTAWLSDQSLSIEQIRLKVAAPAPDGFGLSAQPTTLRRLRNLVENCRASVRVSDAFDTAHDLLEDETCADTAPLHQALCALVYARAVDAARQQADLADLDRLVTVITKLEKLNPDYRRPSPEKPVTSRHRIELSVLPPPASAPVPATIQIRATPLPEET